MSKSVSERMIDRIKKEGRDQLTKLVIYRHREQSINTAIKALIVVVEWCQEVTNYEPYDPSSTPYPIYASDCYWFNPSMNDDYYIGMEEVEENEMEEIYVCMDAVEKEIKHLRRLYRSTSWMRKKLEQMLLDKRASVFKYRISRIQYTLVLRSGVLPPLTGLSGDRSEAEPD